MTQIDINNVSKTIHKNKVLDGVTLHMESGTVYGLQGINGSGKTMLMRMILGLIHPTEGSVSVNGEVLGKEIEFPRSVGFLLETPAFLDRYSGFENLKMLSELRWNLSDGQICEIISMVGLNPTDKKKYRKYSLGMKQRLGIAAAVMGEPEIVILDEPTNALDDSGVEVVKQIIKEQKERGALVVISCHDYSILEEMSDVIIKLEAGKIVTHMRVKTEPEEKGCESHE